ncbi:hypothetical protein K432DRAFT_409116 [Lepidopterella palustris CBS 459.81]|uniref:C2H2-type domain-containing protein n=1 Tax=Lepidopterella palustris CBS 459.81 TaxID=1314670 RepID=A0A8E2JAD8_9PEZI|nr:hypothetical protein K432DRAFT_409116 [Lepidopterella palustris CBS 459.81]
MDAHHYTAPFDEHYGNDATPTSSATGLPDLSLASMINMAGFDWSPSGGMHEGEMQQFSATPFTSPFAMPHQDDMNTTGNWNLQQPHALSELHAPGLGHDGFAGAGAGHSQMQNRPDLQVFNSRLSEASPIPCSPAQAPALNNANLNPDANNFNINLNPEFTFPPIINLNHVVNNTLQPNMLPIPTATFPTIPILPVSAANPPVPPLPFPPPIQANGKWLCTYSTDCTRLFTRNSDAERHIWTVHLKTKEYWCPAEGCSRSYGGRKPFPRADKCKEHAKKMHKIEM